MATDFEICRANFTLVVEFHIDIGRRSISNIRRKDDFALTNLFRRIDVFFSSNNKGRTSCFSTKKALLNFI